MADPGEPPPLVSEFDKMAYAAQEKLIEAHKTVWKGHIEGVVESARRKASDFNRSSAATLAASPDSKEQNGSGPVGTDNQG